jgi:glycosyltransferase involved in cell wall biosynthesis
LYGWCTKSFGMTTAKVLYLTHKSCNYPMPIVDLIIPVLNEEASIGLVLKDLPGKLLRHVIVCDNGSIDKTMHMAASCGAVVLQEPARGYGNACLKGMEFISQQDMSPDIVVFLDGDYSDFPEELPSIIKPIIEQKADLVIGARNSAMREAGSMTPQQVFGNWLACRMIHLLYGHTFTDLGPFRAIAYPKLLELNMCDRNYGWTVEMQVKALKKQLKIMEVPVHYRKRKGTSKVSGTIRGTIGAGYKIIKTILKYS